MKGKGGPPPAKRADVALRREQAIALSLAGNDWQTIADTLGYASRGAAHTDVVRALKERRETLGLAVDDLREREDARLNAAIATAWAIMETRHPLIQGGKIVLDEDGRPLLDVGPNLAAAAAVVRFSESLRKLHGLDAPAKVSVSGTVQHQYSIDSEVIDQV